MDQRPSVFSYLDYRLYMKEILAFLQTTKNRSKRSISIRSGFKSTSYLNMVMDGRRSFTISSAKRFANGLELGKFETEFLKKLVAFNEASDLVEKDKRYKDLLQFRKFQKIKTSAAAEYEYFSNWYVVAILEGLGTSWRKKSVEQMAQSLGINPGDVTRTLALLKQLNLIKEDADGWVKSDHVFQTPSETNSLNIRNYHKEMIQKALAKIDVPEDRTLYGLTLPMSEKNYKDLKGRVAQYIKDLGALFADDPDPKKMFQMNFQVFSLFDIEN